MKLLFFILYLIVIWLEQSVGFSLTPIKGFSLSNIVFYSFIFLWLFKFIKSGVFFLNNPINKYVFLLLLLYIFGIPIKYYSNEFINLNLFNELIYFKNIFEPFFLYFIIFYILDSKEDCYRYLLALQFFLLLTIGTMFLEVAGIANFERVHVLSWEAADGRSSGFGNPNDYASFLVLFIPMLFSFILSKTKFFIKFFYIALSVLSLTALIITGSRGGLISCFFSFFVLFSAFFKYKAIDPKKTILCLFLIPILFISSLFFAPQRVKNTLFMKLNLDYSANVTENKLDGFTSGRTLIWREGFRVFLEKPFFGFGQNSFAQLLQKKSGVFAAAHNLYLSYLVEYGIAGLIILLLLFYKIFIHTIKNMKLSNEKKYLLIQIAFLSGFSGYIFSLLGVNAVNSKPMFWIYISIILRLIDLLNQNNLKEDYEKIHLSHIG